MTKGRRTLWPAVLGLSALVLAGCEAVPKNAGFDDVNKVVTDRLGQPVQWRGVTADDASVDRAVHDLLARPLSADAAVQVALLNNRTLQATYEDLGIAQADLVQAGLLKNPVFSAEIRPPFRPPGQTYLNFTVEDDFIDVLLRPARQRVAEAAFAQTKGRVASAVLQLAADTRVAFYNCQAAGQDSELQRSVNQAQADSYDAAKRLYQVGNVNDRTLLGEAAQLGRTKLQLAGAEQRVAETRERLGDLMGMWGTDAWTTAGRLADPPPREVDPAGLESLAIRQRPDLEAARQDLLLQARTLGFTFQYRYVQSLNLGLDGERETDGQVRFGPSLNVPIPIFDQGQAAVARGQALLRQSQQRFYAGAVGARSQVRLARTAMFNARARVEFYRREVLPTEMRLVDQTQLHFNGMYVGVFELLQVKRDEIAAGQEYIAALRDYWTARAELERAVGGRLPVPTDSTTRLVSVEPAGR